MCASAEVKKYSDLILACTKIIVELTPEVTTQVIGGLEFENDPVIDDRIDPLVADEDASISNLNADLSLDHMSAARQLDLHCRGVDALEKAESESTMDFVEGADDRVSKLLLNEGIRAGLDIAKSWSLAGIDHHQMSSGRMRATRRPSHTERDGLNEKKQRKSLHKRSGTD